VKKDPTLKGNEVADWIAERVAPYKKLRGGVLFIDAIPKSPSGKILRRELKDNALQEIKAKL
jgi:4-coumarate--CoA ligase